MAISDKLNYLIETKQLFKDRLNSLGAEIIESTTFRNYLNWLNTFYGDASNKTDLAKNGVVGRTSQDGDPTPGNPVEINNISGDVEYKVTGEGISETFPLSLGDIELCAISDYKDRIYSQNGEFYLRKETGKVVLDGSENITQNYNQSMFRVPLDNFVHRIESPSNLGKSNYYTCRKYTDMYNGTIGTGFEFGNQGADYIYIRNKDITSINDLKTWLSTHNTEVQYVLATPTTTGITQENYPTLYSQLLAIQDFLTKYKINKEFLLDYSSPEIEY